MSWPGSHLYPLEKKELAQLNYRNYYLEGTLAVDINGIHANIGPVLWVVMANVEYPQPLAYCDGAIIRHSCL